MVQIDYLRKLEEDTGLPLPRAIERLFDVNQWGIAHSIYRHSRGANSKYPRAYHVGTSVDFSDSLPGLDPEEKQVVSGILFSHDVDTTVGIPHLDNTEVPRKILTDQITGQGGFEGSDLPYWLSRAFCPPEKIAEEIQRNGTLYRIAQGIENLDHMILDSLHPLMPETYERIKGGTVVDLNRGGIVIPENVYAQGEPLGDFLERSRRNVLIAYTPENLAGLYIEGVLRTMMMKLIAENGDPTSLYKWDDTELYNRLSKKHLPPEEVIALHALRDRRLPHLKRPTPNPMIFEHRLLAPSPSTKATCDAFKTGMRELYRNGEKLLGENTAKAFYTVIKHENVFPSGGKGFPREELLTLCVFYTLGSPGEDEVRGSLKHNPYFGPFMESKSLDSS